MIRRFTTGVPLTELADRALVRVFRDDTPVGVGFLVGEDTMLTCAHVAATAARVPHPSVGDVALVDFPMIDATGRVEAEVVHVADGADMVTLRVATVPAAARAIRVVAADDLRDHRVRAYGVPENRAHGVWSEGVVRGPIADGLIHVEDNRGYGLPLLRGFSGSPLIDDRLSAVVGMVISVESRQERRIGYALSGDALYEAWPELAGIAAQPSPFRGLEPFGVNDFERYFGRDAQARDLVERVGDSRAAVVTGPSGIGKTSFVLAGVVPRLVGEDVAAVVVRPGLGGGPWRSTATKLATLLHPGGSGLDDVDGIVERLTGGGLEDVVNRVLVNRGLRRLVVVIDQLDEAQARYADESAELLRDLFSVVATHGPRGPSVNLIITVSPGSLERLLEDTRISERLAGAHTVVLGAPKADDLRVIVEGPLAPAGMPILQEGLADSLVTEVARERNPLPVLEFGLTLLWDRQRRGLLTHEAYQDLGGLSGVLSRYAEGVWARFATTDEHERRFRRLLTQLVSPLPTGDVVRRVVALDELGDLRPPAEDLAATRLLTLGAAPDGTPTVELAHESLVRHWQRLGTWVAEDRDFRVWQDEMDVAAQRWSATSDRALLLRGNVLSDGLSFAEERKADLTDDQRRFLAASLLARRIRRWGWTTTSIGSVVLVVTMVVAIVQITARTREQQAIAAAEQLLQRAARIDDGAQRLALTARAFRTADTPGTREALRAWSRVMRDSVTFVPTAERDRGNSSINADGTAVVAMTPTGEVEIWDLRRSPPTHVRVPRAGDDPGTTDWLGTDRLVDALSTNQVVVRDIRTGRSRLTLDVDADFVVGDAGGRWLAYGWAGRPEIGLVDTTRPDAPPVSLTAPGNLAFLRQPPPDAAFLRDVLPSGEVAVESMSGQRLLVSARGARPMPGTAGDPVDVGLAEPVSVGCDGTVLSMRGFVTGTVFASHRDDLAECEQGMFSADGVVAARRSHRGTVTIAPVRGGAPARELPVPDDYDLERVAVERDGAYRILLRGTESYLQLRIPRPDPLDSALTSADEARLTPDGRYVVLSSIEVWDVATRKRVASAPPGRTVMSPDGRLLARLPEGSGDITVLRLPHLTPARTITAPSSQTSRLWFLDEHRFAILNEAELSVWDAGSGRRLGEPIPLRLPDPGSFSSNVEVAAAGAEVVVLTGDDMVRRYRVADGTEVPGTAFKHGAGVADDQLVTVHAADRLLAVRVTGAVEVWHLDTREQEARLVLPESVIPVALRFRDDSDELEITDGTGVDHADFYQGSMIMLWERDLFWGLPKIIGAAEDRTGWLAGVPAAPGYANAGSTSELGGLESAKPADWLAIVCRVMRDSGLDTEQDNLPGDAWRGPVCG